MLRSFTSPHMLPSRPCSFIAHNLLIKFSTSSVAASTSSAASLQSELHPSDRHLSRLLHPDCSTPPTQRSSCSIWLLVVSQPRLQRPIISWRRSRSWHAVNLSSINLPARNALIPKSSLEGPREYPRPRAYYSESSVGLECAMQT